MEARSLNSTRFNTPGINFRAKVNLTELGQAAGGFAVKTDEVPILHTGAITCTLTGNGTLEGMSKLGLPVKEHLIKHVKGFQEALDAITNLKLQWQERSKGFELAESILKKANPGIEKEGLDVPALPGTAAETLEKKKP